MNVVVDPPAREVECSRVFQEMVDEIEHAKRKLNRSDWKDFYRVLLFFVTDQLVHGKTTMKEAFPFYSSWETKQTAFALSLEVIFSRLSSSSVTAIEEGEMLTRILEHVTGKLCDCYRKPKTGTPTP